MRYSIPELDTIGQQLIRIPSEVDVPVTQRVLEIIDTPPMQRLRHISQLGLVGYVYPGAVHSRFEHSLGVYRLACVTLRHLLSAEPQFADLVTETELKTFLLAALLHDIGHWPFCHAIEDLRLAEFPSHEALARSLICNSPVADLIQSQWSVAPQMVAELIASTRSSAAEPSVLRNLLSGPVDIDKMDYLQRDSLHAGVPYGRNFDVSRLIASLCVGDDGKSMAITEKGKTAAEMMVFARYVMFSEVYWHHTVRSATAMLQRLVHSLRENFSTQEWLTQTEVDFSNQLLSMAAADPRSNRLATSLFGRHRRLYKRLAQYTLSDSPDVFAAVARRPFDELVNLSDALGAQLSAGLSCSLQPGDLIIDAPPVKLEVQFKVDVRQSSNGNLSACFRRLSDISPVVRALATEQFDSFVKRVRIFVAPQRAADLQISQSEITDALLALAGC